METELGNTRAFSPAPAPAATHHIRIAWGKTPPRSKLCMSEISILQNRDKALGAGHMQVRHRCVV